MFVAGVIMVATSIITMIILPSKIRGHREEISVTVVSGEATTNSEAE